MQLKLGLSASVLDYQPLLVGFDYHIAALGQDSELLRKRDTLLTDKFVVDPLAQVGVANIARNLHHDDRGVERDLEGNRRRVALFCGSHRGRRCR